MSELNILSWAKVFVDITYIHGWVYIINFHGSVYTTCIVGIITTPGLIFILYIITKSKLPPSFYLSKRQIIFYYIKEI